MILFKKEAELHNYLEKQREKGRKIGFVPTMGALHQGHISLVENCRKENDLTVSSLFINPTQFNDPADFSKYPVTIEADIVKLEKAGVDVLFLPTVAEIYPDGIDTPKSYKLGRIEEVLEGKFRPGHFQGVCMVVDRLLSIVDPHTLYLGQKDYQQCMVIRKLVEITSRSTELKIIPTLRESSGLAMSSRNMRLNDEQKNTATTIYKTLCYIKEHFMKGDLSALKDAAVKKLEEKGFRVDYVEIADAKTLEPLEYWDGETKAVALIAVFLGEVRLIDNLLL